MMGIKSKVEERIFCDTTCFDELCIVYPETKFNLLFIGPEVSPLRHEKTVKRSENLSGWFYRDPIYESVKKVIADPKNIISD